MTWTRAASAGNLIDEFAQSGYFTVVSSLNSYEEIDPYLDGNKAKVAIIIPHDFSKRVRTRRDTTIGIILDGANSNTANIAQGYIAAIAQRYSQKMGGGPVIPLIDSRSRVWYNTELKSRNFIIPGLIAVIMTVIIALLTSLTIAKEWDRGTMEQLISTPIKPVELVIGKLVPYFVIGFADTVFVILMSTELFGVPLRGSVSLLLVLSSIFLFGGLSMGILISIVGRNQTVGKPDGNAQFLPSGFSALRFYLQYIKYAGAPSDHYLFCACPVFCDNSERDIPERLFAEISYMGNSIAYHLRSSCFPARDKEV